MRYPISIMERDSDHGELHLVANGSADTPSTLSVSRVRSKVKFAARDADIQISEVSFLGQAASTIIVVVNDDQALDSSDYQDLLREVTNQLTDA